MKTFFKIALISITLAFLGLSATASAATDAVNQRDINKIERASTRVSQFLQKLSSGGTSRTSVIVSAKLASSALDDLANHDFYNLGSEYKAASVKVKESAAKLKKDTDKMVAAIRAKDEKGYSDASQSFKADAKAFDTSIDDLNTAVSNSSDPNQWLYVSILVACAVVALVSFIWAFAFGNVNNPALLNARRTIAYTSLVPVIGAAITVVSYMFAKNGGSYIIAYGPVLFGLIVFVRAIFDYFKLKKTVA